MNTFYSDISKKEFPVSERVSAKTLRPSIFNNIQKENPQFSLDSYISLSEVKYYIKKALSDYLVSKIGELSDLEKTVLASVTDSNTLIDKLKIGDEQQPTIGERIADKVASFGGSWTFIISFGAFILVWIVINVYWFLNRGYDPYPFILLNLILSCLSALQAPVIMMSQNRTEDRDRTSAKNDYMINLKSELEIKNLNEKVDYFIDSLQQEYLELQKFHNNIIDALNRIEMKSGN
jgi:uncharacterized membrane protein